MMLPRFEISADQIEIVVSRFYNEVRKHPVLGPVFARHVTDWPAHEVKIAAFWRNAILLERIYDGNPMAVHKAAGDVRPDMFPIWLDLFETILVRSLSSNQAESWSALARRIGRGLSHGLADTGGVPNLRG